MCSLVVQQRSKRLVALEQEEAEVLLVDDLQAGLDLHLRGDLEVGTPHVCERLADLAGQCRQLAVDADDLPVDLFDDLPEDVVLVAQQVVQGGVRQSKCSLKQLRLITKAVRSVLLDHARKTSDLGSTELQYVHQCKVEQVRVTLQLVLLPAVQPEPMVHVLTRQPGERIRHSVVEATFDDTEVAQNVPDDLGHVNTTDVVHPVTDLEELLDLDGLAVVQGVAGHNDS